MIANISLGAQPRVPVLPAQVPRVGPLLAPAALPAADALRIVAPGLVAGEFVDDGEEVRGAAWGLETIVHGGVGLAVGVVPGVMAAAVTGDFAFAHCGLWL